MLPFATFTSIFSGELMKKYLLCTSLLFACTALSTENFSAPDDRIENVLDTIATDFNTSFFDLPFWTKAQIAALTTLGGACTWLGTRAFTNIFEETDKRVVISQWKEWQLSQKITTPVGLIWFGKILTNAEKPEGIARNANADGLLSALLTCQTTDEIKETIDARFVTERFPRAVAFQQLSTLHASLNKLFKLVKETQTIKPHRNFNKIIQLLNQNLNHVNQALLILKNDSRWFEECNAHALKQAQATQQSEHNARLAGTAINLAHAYSH